MTEPNDILDRNVSKEFKPGLRQRLGLGVIKFINNLATFEPDRNPDKAPPLQ